jgi:hypothetical protein
VEQKNQDPQQAEGPQQFAAKSFLHQPPMPSESIEAIKVQMLQIPWSPDEVIQ